MNDEKNPANDIALDDRRKFLKKAGAIAAAAPAAALLLSANAKSASAISLYGPPPDPQ